MAKIRHNSRLNDKIPAMERFLYRVYNVDKPLAYPDGTRPDMETASFDDLLEAGLEEKINLGVARILFENNRLAIFYFPKYAPSRPFESLICVFSKQRGNPFIDLAQLTNDEQQQLFAVILSTERCLVEVVTENKLKTDKVFSFIHYGPKDLPPANELKKSYHTSFSSLHFHIQAYGHSLSVFPQVFKKDRFTKYSNLENSKRLARDPFTRIANDILLALGYHAKIQHDAIYLTKGTINDLSIVITHFNYWWKKIATCFVLSSENNQSLLPKEQRIQRVYNLCQHLNLSSRSQKLLFFLAENIKQEETNEWNCFYRGPNGSLGFEFDPATNNRSIVFAPRLTRSWMRHFAMVNPSEITLKNEDGEDSISADARKTIMNIHKQVLMKLSD